MGTQPRKGFARVESQGQSLGDREPVTVPSEPTLEQCENLAMAMGSPILLGAVRPPYYEESMRRLHALIVRMLNGDEDATKTIDLLRLAFAAPRRLRSDPRTQS